MLKITRETDSEGNGAVLRLEGQIVGRWVAELRRVCAEERHGSTDALIIDLREVTFIDRAGIALFDEIHQSVTLVNCSLFAVEQLKTVMERHDAVRR